MEYAGQSTKQVPVHKKDAEGILLIDALTGHVITEQHDRPGWAEGLVLAQLAERHVWWTNRLGGAYGPEMAQPEMLAFEDLGWCKMVADEDGLDVIESYHDADEDFRMDVLAQLLNIERSSDLTDEQQFANVKGIVAEVAIASDNTRTAEEMQDLRIAQEGRFEDVSEDRKTGTNGR